MQAGLDLGALRRRTRWFSTYPFQIFGRASEKVEPKAGDLPFKGDTIIGNDVWLGYDVLVMPGVEIGHGAIVASRSVVVSDVPPYAIIGGNPAVVIKPRFSPTIVEELLSIAWWVWPIDKVSRNLAAIVGADLAALRASA